MPPEQQDSARVPAAGKWQLLWKIGKTLAARGLTGTATVLLTYFVSRVYGVENAGFVNLVWLLLLLVALFAKFGIEYSGVRHLSVHASQRDAAGANAFLNTNAGILLVLLAAALPVALFAGKQLFAGYGAGAGELLLFCLILPVFGILAFLAPLHRGLSRPDASYYFDQGGIALLLLAIIAVSASPDSFIHDFLLALLAAALLVLLASLWYFSRSYRNCFATGLALVPVPTISALRDGLPGFLTSISEYLMFWIGLLLLGMLDSQANVGIHAVLIRTAQLTVVAMGIINAIISPTLATLQASHRSRRLRHYVGKIWKLNFILGAASILAVSLFAPFALRGSGIAPARDIYFAFFLLLLPQVIKILLGPVGQIMAMSGTSQRKLATLALAAVVPTLLLSAALIPAFGIVGAAAGYCVGLCGYHLLCMHDTRTRLGFLTFEAGIRTLRRLLRKQ